MTRLIEYYHLYISHAFSLEPKVKKKSFHQHFIANNIKLRSHFQADTKTHLCCSGPYTQVTLNELRFADSVKKDTSSVSCSSKG